MVSFLRDYVLEEKNKGSGVVVPTLLIFSGHWSREDTPTGIYKVCGVGVFVVCPYGRMMFRFQNTHLMTSGIAQMTVLLFFVSVT